MKHVSAAPPGGGRLKHSVFYSWMDDSWTLTIMVIIKTHTCFWHWHGRYFSVSSVPSGWFPSTVRLTSLICLKNTRVQFQYSHIWATVANVCPPTTASNYTTFKKVEIFALLCILGHFRKSHQVSGWTNNIWCIFTAVEYKKGQVWLNQ